MTRPPDCEDHEIVESLDLLHVTVCAHQRRLLAYIAEWDRRERWRDDGCRDMAQWVSGRLGISNWTARRWVEAGHALDRLPQLSSALEEGRLSLDKVVEPARFATEDDEGKLIEWARRVSTGRSVAAPSALAAGMSKRPGTPSAIGLCAGGGTTTVPASVSRGCSRPRTAPPSSRP
ncbi:MAG: DUF222 domain-containing protein [Actinomycetota bacterium]